MSTTVPAPARALAVGAHPDDCELGCGGTLTGWAGAGCVTAIAIATDGSRGSHDPDLPDDVLRDRRAAEARAAAAVLGARDVRFLGAVDGELAVTPELRRDLAAVIRELRPEIVLAHDPWLAYDPHPDHPVVGRLVLEALYDAREPRAARELAAAGLAPWRPRELWLYRPAVADHHEPIGDALEAKARAVLCHHSQYETSFGLDPAAPDLEGFSARLRAHAREQSLDGVTPCESFRRVALPR